MRTRDRRRHRLHTLWRGGIWGLVLWAGLSAACSIRFNWPRHQLTVSARVETQGLERAYLVHDVVELLTCQQLEQPTLPPGFGTAQRRWTVSLAHAHGPTTPTRIGDTCVLELAPEPRATELGAFAPPPGEYCAVRLSWSAADEDAIGREAASVEMLGRSLWAQATPEGHAQRLEAWTGASFDVTLEFDEPLQLGDDEDVIAELVLRYRLKGIARGLRPNEEPEARARALLLELRERVSVEVIR